jgi:threonyl-tRNA synthetase
LKRLKHLGIRAEYDSRNEKLGFKIREAQLQKIPYMLVVGDQEVQNRTVTVRLNDGRNLNGVVFDQLVDVLKTELITRSLKSLVAEQFAPKSESNQEVRH